MNTQQTGHSGCALVRPPQADDAESSTIGSKNDESKSAATYGIGHRITCVDRAIIRRHIESSRAALTSYPVQMRNWQTGGKLPANLRTAQLPPDLEFKLSPLGAGYQRVIVGRDVLLIDVAMGRIVDVMQNADAFVM